MGNATLYKDYLSDSARIRSGLQVRLCCPKQISEVYALAIEVENSIFGLFLELLHAYSFTLKNRNINSMLRYQKEEVQKWSEQHKFALNCEIAKFYENGGCELDPVMDAAELAKNRDQINMALDKFNKQMNMIKENCVDSISKSSVDQNTANLLASLIQARDHAVELFHFLSGCCPAGQLKNELEKISAIFLRGSIDLDEICVKMF